MGGVELPQMLLFLSADAGKTRCRLKGSAGFFCLSLSALVFLSVTMGSYSSALIPDTEEFVSIVSVTEKLSEQAARAADERLQSELQTLVTLMMEEERKKTQSEAMNSAMQRESTQETAQNGSILPALSAVLHPAPPAGINSDSRSSRNPEEHASPNLEQLHTELRDLRGQFELMKSQHNKEIKLLMNELDEEKRIRLTLQMEIQRMKKHMSK